MNCLSNPRSFRDRKGQCVTGISCQPTRYTGMTVKKKGNPEQVLLEEDALS
jgi:hypothetical protein